MKKLVCFFIPALLICVACGSSNKEQDQHKDNSFTPKGNMADLVYNPMRPDGTLDSSYLPIMMLHDTLFDFGSIPEGDTVTHVFTFTNTGTAPLLVTRASSTCGCTIPKWTTAPVEPNGTGEITVKFNSIGRPDHQSKEVTIFANTFPSEHKVRIQGNVIKRN